jgi:hypothetical protein
MFDLVEHSMLKQMLSTFSFGREDGQYLNDRCVYLPHFLLGVVEETPYNRRLYLEELVHMFVRHIVLFSRIVAVKFRYFFVRKRLGVDS